MHLSVQLITFLLLITLSSQRCRGRPLNLSDHQPLLSNFRCTLHPLDDLTRNGSAVNEKQPKPNWGKLRMKYDKYMVSVEEHLSSLPLPDPKELVQKPELIDAYLDHIAGILQSTTLAKIPVKKFH